MDDIKVGFASCLKHLLSFVVGLRDCGKQYIMMEDPKQPSHCWMDNNLSVRLKTSFYQFSSTGYASIHCSMLMALLTWSLPNLMQGTITVVTPHSMAMTVIIVSDFPSPVLYIR